MRSPNLHRLGEDGLLLDECGSVARFLDLEEVAVQVIEDLLGDRDGGHVIWVVGEELLARRGHDDAHVVPGDTSAVFLGVERSVALHGGDVVRVEANDVARVRHADLLGEWVQFYRSGTITANGYRLPAPAHELYGAFTNASGNNVWRMISRRANQGFHCLLGNAFCPLDFYEMSAVY